MKLVHQSVEVLEQSPGIDGMYNAIEDAARTCYKSTGRLGKQFVDKLIDAKHTAMLEHGTVYLTVPFGSSAKDDHFVEKYLLKYLFANNPYSRCTCTIYPTKELCPEEFLDIFDEFEGVTVYYITTNFRVILENFDDINDALQYWSEPTRHPKRVSVKIVCDRIGSQSLTRHRKFSFAQESTRYCNYSKKDKFGNEITFVAPYWYTWGNGSNDRECSMDSEFELCCVDAERSYLRMISWGASPQQARQILPNCLKTEIIMTGFADDWEYFLKVRTTNEYGVPHPDMINLATMIKDKIKDKLIKL